MWYETPVDINVDIKVYYEQNAFTVTVIEFSNIF